MIKEEIEKLSEGDDHETGAKIMKSASGLLKEIEKFKKETSEKVRSDVASHLDALEASLNRIVNSPMQYVDVAKPTAKKVTLKPKKENLV